MTGFRKQKIAPSHASMDQSPFKKWRDREKRFRSSIPACQDLAGKPVSKRKLRWSWPPAHHHAQVRRPTTATRLGMAVPPAMSTGPSAGGLEGKARGGGGRRSRSRIPLPAARTRGGGPLPAAAKASIQDPSSGGDDERRRPSTGGGDGFDPGSLFRRRRREEPAIFRRRRKKEAAWTLGRRRRGQGNGVCKSGIGS